MEGASRKQLYALEDVTSKRNWTANFVGVLGVTLVILLLFTPNPLHLAIKVVPAVIGLFFLYFLWSQRAQPIPGLPGPKPHFYFGHILDAWKHIDSLHDRHVELQELYGPGAWTTCSPFMNGRGDLWLPNDEKISEYVHHTNWLNYQKGQEMQEIFEELIGEGIFAVNGAEWKFQRGIASQMFSLRALRDDMCPIFMKHGETVLKVLATHAKKKTSFDLQDIFFKYTLTAFSEIGFGEDLDAIVRPAEEVPFVAAFDKVQAAFAARPLIPGWRAARALLKLTRGLVSISSNEKIIYDGMKIIDAYAASVITKRLEQAETDNSNNGKDLISRFMQQNKTAPTPKFLRDVVLNFLIAGRDTTACALTWLFYNISNHPKEEALLVAEIKEAFRKGGNSYEIAQNLPYLDAAIKETLRLHPSVPFEFKTCVKDDTLPDGTFVPAGTWVSYPPYVWGRSKKLWGEDALEWKPSRWVDQKHSQFKYVTFNVGPRICLGKELALLESKLLAALILNRYKVKLVPNRKVTYTVTITLPVKDGLHVTVQPRN